MRVRTGRSRSSLTGPSRPTARVVPTCCLSGPALSSRQKGRGLKQATPPCLLTKKDPKTREKGG